MLRCKNLFFFLFLSVFFFFFPQFPPPYSARPGGVNCAGSRAVKSFREQSGSSDASGGATPAALHTIRARERKITSGLHIARSCGVLFRMMGGARKGKGKGKGKGAEPPRPSLSICLRKHKAGPTDFIRLWNIYGQLKGHQRKSN